LPERRSRSNTMPGQARSGSITEQIVNANGITKLVLDVSSSSEEGAPREGSGNVEGETQDGEQKAKKKKRKTRRKKRTAGESAAEGENAPLLEDDGAEDE